MQPKLALQHKHSALLLVAAVAAVALACSLASSPAGTAAPTQPEPIGPTSGEVMAQPGDTVVNLTWQPIAGARGYFIYRDNSSVPLNPAPITDTHFQDIGLTNGRTYTYAIAPVDQNGQVGARSAPIQAIPKSR